MSAGTQGQVRYALLVDDQATSKLNTFKNSLVQLGNSSTTLQRNIQGFTAQLSKQSTAFTAGINPIKQQGSALTNLSNNMKSNAAQFTTLGTKIKDSASKFAGFATGLSTTANGFLQLGAGARDYGDAQIAVDKAQRKLSLSQEALNKAQDKLQSLTSKGIKSGKEYAQAQLDVKQAQDGLAISTQLVGERQEDMFDAQTQFVASVIPTTLGAVGTLGSAYKDLGLKADTFTKGLSKMKGGLSSMAGSVGISSKAFIGMAGAIGLASVAAIEFFDQIKRGGEIKELQKFNETLAATNESRQKEIDKLREQKNSWGQIMKDWVFGGPIGKAIVGDPGSVIIDQVIKSLESKISTVDASKPLEKLFTMIANSPIPPSAKTGIQAQIQHILDIYNNKTNWQNPEFTKTSQGIVNDLLVTLGNSIKSADLTTGLTGAMRQLFVKINKGVEFGNSPMTQLFAIDPKPISASLDPIGKLYKVAMDKIMLANKGGAEFAKLFGDKTTIAAEAMAKFNAAAGNNTGMDSYNQAITDGVQKFNDLVTSTELGIVTTNKYRQALIQSVGSHEGFANAAKMSTSQLELNEKAMLGDMDAVKQLNDALTNAASTGFSDFVKAGEDIFKKGFNKLGIKKDFDVISKEADKFQANFIKKLTGAGFEGGKQFALKFAETPKKFIKPQDMFAFDDLISWIKANGGLPAEEFTKQLIAKWKDLAPETKTKYGALLAGLPDIAGQIGTDSGTSLITSLNEQLKAFKPDKGFLTALDLMTGKITQIEKVKISKKDQRWSDKLIKGNKGTGQQGAYGGPGGGTTTITPPIQKMPVVDQTAYQKGLQLAVDNANQTVQFITSAISKISSIKMPTPNESTFQKGLQLAINNSSQTVQFIGKELSKVSSIKVPPPNESKYQKGLQLAINNAAQTTKFIKQALDKIGSIKVPAPKFNSFNSALDQAVSDTKRAVREINNALKNINKPGGGGNGSGPGATTGPFAEGGSVIANTRTTATFGEAGPELAMFIPLKGGSGRGSSGSSGSGSNGNIFIEIHEHKENGREEVRRFKASMGQDRYRFGA